MITLVSDIDYKKEQVNSLCESRGEKPMFDLSKDGESRSNILSTPANSKADLNYFAINLFKVVYEETMGEISKDRLGHFRNDPFTFYVKALRNNECHIPDDKKTRVTIEDVYNKYLGHLLPPDNPEEYQAIQRGLLMDFITFLDKIINYYTEGKIYKGLIEKDTSGNLHVGKILLAKNQEKYLGCSCGISFVVANNNFKTKSAYPQYAPFTTYIDVSIDGIIEYDDNICHCGSVKLPDHLMTKAGDGIKITRINSRMRSKELYKEFAIIFNTYKTKQKPSTPPPSYMTGETATIL